MATWRKVLVSGSSAHVSTLEVGTAGTIAGTITNRSKVSDSHLSGSFTGSFVGDGSQLDGVTTVFPSTAELGGLDATKFYVNDGSNKFVSGSQLATYVFGEANQGGDATIADTGAVTIGTDKVTAAMVNSDVAGTGLQQHTDGSLRIASAAAGDGLTGGGGSALAVDIDGLSAETLGTGDTIAFNDDDDNGIHKVTVDNLITKTPALLTEEVAAVADDFVIFLDGSGTGDAKKEKFADLIGNVASTGLDASNGTLAVDVSDFMSNGTDNRILTATGTDAFQGEANLTFDGANLTLAGAMTASGDISGSAEATMSMGTYIGDGSQLTGVQQDIDSLDAFTGVPHATDDEFLISDAGTEKRATMTMLANGAFALVSGDATIAAGGALTIEAGAVEDGMLADGVATGLAGTGMTATSGVLNVIGGTGITANADDIAIAATHTTITSILNDSLKVGRADGNDSIDFGTDDQILFDVDNTERLRVDAAGVDVTGALTVSSNATISGDLTVNGTTTTITSTNTAIADRFIMIASGSAASNTDGGIVVQEGANEGTGSALYHDTGDNRWAVAKSVIAKATAVTALEHVVTVKQLGDNDAPVDGDKEYGAGEMAINSNGTIWIYS